MTQRASGPIGQRTEDNDAHVASGPRQPSVVRARPRSSHHVGAKLALVSGSPTSRVDPRRALTVANGRPAGAPGGEPANVCAPDPPFRSGSGSRDRRAPGEPEWRLRSLPEGSVELLVARSSGILRKQQDGTWADHPRSISGYGDRHRRSLKEVLAAGDAGRAVVNSKPMFTCRYLVGARPTSRPSRTVKAPEPEGCGAGGGAHGRLRGTRTASQ